MLDLSPEKLVMLLAVGLVVLGPNKLPAAARGLAHGLARARGLAASLTDPITTTLAEPVRAQITEPLRTGLGEPLQASLVEPRRALDNAVSQLRATIANHPLPGPTDQPATPADPVLN
jgi:Sec-independent protein translocase protein TatA